MINYLSICSETVQNNNNNKQEKNIYDKCMPLQCEVFPLRKALMLPASLDSYNSMLLHLAASIWDAAQTLF